MTKLLLSLGISPDVCSGPHKGTPLHHVVSGIITNTVVKTMQYNPYPTLPLNTTEKNCWTEVAKLLLEHNADIEARDGNNCTPLHRAVFHGITGMVELLLEHNADIGAKGKYKETPLHHAAESYGNIQVAKLLLERNADIGKRDINN